MKIGKLIIILALAIPFIFSSCTDEDKNNLSGLLKTAAFPRFASVNPPVTLGVQAIEDVVYSFDIIDGNNNLASYQLDMYATIGGSQTDTVNVNTATSFPVSYTLTATDLATLLGITVGDIGFGDNFFFTATATTVDGLVYNGANRLAFDDLGDDDPSTNAFEGGGISNDLLDETGYLQAFEFNFIILCPQVDLEDIPGTYDVTTAGFFAVLSNTFEVIQGSNATEFIMVDPYGHLLPGEPADKYNVTFDVNTANAAITVPDQPAWDSSHPAIGTPYGPGTFNDGVGFAFPCIGQLSFIFDHQVAAGSFGTGPFVGTKQGI